MIFVPHDATSVVIGLRFLDLRYDYVSLVLPQFPRLVLRVVTTQKDFARNESDKTLSYTFLSLSKGYNKGKEKMLL